MDYGKEHSSVNTNGPKSGSCTYNFELLMELTKILWVVPLAQPEGRHVIFHPHVGCRASGEYYGISKYGRRGVKTRDKTRRILLRLGP